MEVPLTSLLLWSVCCLLVARAPMEVNGAAIAPQACNTQTSIPCLAMVGYVPSVNIDLSHIASLFSLNYTSLLGPNEIDPSLQDLSTVVLPQHKVYFIPQTCGCINSTRTVNSTDYTVVSGDSLSTIADYYYSHLVTYQQIAAVNGIPNPDLIDAGQEFMIPIPCACFNQSDGTRPAVFLSYQIQTGDTLSRIANTYNTSVAQLKEFNSLSSDSFNAADVLFVPRPVCKANFSSGVEDGNLTVVEGTYELTANGCVQCSCNNGTLHCIQAHSSLGTTCSSNLTCHNSSLALGASTASQGNQGCSVQSCIYKGYSSKSGIMSRLETEEDPTCPIALPPQAFYKPPTGLVASPLGPPATPSTVSSPPPLSTPVAPPPSSTTTPNSAIGLGGFFSWWWCLLALGLLL